MFSGRAGSTDVKRHGYGIIFIMHHMTIERCKDPQANLKEMQFRSNLLTSRMRYEVSR